MNSYKRNIAISLCVNFILFSYLWLFLCPVYYSRDDVFLMYLLSGGFGNSPTELLHYNHVMHPALGSVLKYCFITWPKINWFSIYLVLSLAISGSVLLYVLLQQQKKAVAFVLYFLLFSGFYCWAFLHLNFSVVSSVAYIAGAVLLFSYSKKNKRWVSYLWPLLILTCASLLRIHTIIPVAIVLAPLFFTIERKTDRLRFFTTVLCACILIFVLNSQHVAYYKKHIPGWEKEEAYRQAAFNFVNQDVQYDAEDRIKQNSKTQLLVHKLFFDKDYFDLESMRTMNKGARVLKTFKETKAIFYWLVIENRAFLFLLLFGAAITFFSIEKKSRIWVLGSLFVAFFLVLFLMLYLKLPYYIVPVLIGSVLAGFIAIVPPVSFPPLKMYLSGIIALLLLSYSLIRVYKTNNKNLRNKAVYEMAVNQLNSKPDSFFVLIHPGFPIDFFPATSSPMRLPLTNVVFNAHFINNEEQKMFTRNGIENLHDLWKNKKTLIWSLPSKGGPSTFDVLLQHYFKDRYNAAVTFSNPLPGFNYGEVRKLQFITNNIP